MTTPHVCGVTDIDVPAEDSLDASQEDVPTHEHIVPEDGHGSLRWGKSEGHRALDWRHPSDRLSGLRVALSGVYAGNVVGPGRSRPRRCVKTPGRRGDLGPHDLPTVISLDSSPRHRRRHELAAVWRRATRPPGRWRLIRLCRPHLSRRADLSLDLRRRRSSACYRHSVA